MPYKNDEDQLASQRRHYANNKGYYAARNKERRKSIKLFLDELKDVPCADCGQRHPPYVMDFDHQQDKTIGVGEIRNHGWGKERILKEVANCEIVCSNCHRIRTHG